MDNYFEDWATSVRATLAEMASQDFGYPIGANEVRERSREYHAVPPNLEPLYAAFDGVSLPDVHVGYFIHPAHFVESAAQRGAPIRIEGEHSRMIHVFGSDGGGSLFAVGVEDAAIYYLPSAAAVIDGVYFENEAVPVCRVAGSVKEFLDRLKVDIEAFVRADQGHKFIAR